MTKTTNIHGTDEGNLTAVLPDAVDKASAWDAIAEKNARIKDLEERNALLEQHGYELIQRLEDSNDILEKLINAEAVIGWVDSWVSNPVGSYSVSALDGLFRMTRDKIAAIPRLEEGRR